MRRREFITTSRWCGGYLAARCGCAAVRDTGNRIPESYFSEQSRHLLGCISAGLERGRLYRGTECNGRIPLAEGQFDRLPALAADLVWMRVAVITTMGDGAYAARAAQPPEGNSAIPIVFALGGDPVAAGLCCKP